MKGGGEERPVSEERDEEGGSDAEQTIRIASAVRADGSATGPDEQPPGSRAASNRPVHPRVSVSHVRFQSGP